jgi:hypothetical protein
LSHAIFWRRLHDGPVYPGGTATTAAPTTIHTIDKDEMLRALQTKHSFSDESIGYLLALNIRVEQGLVARWGE